ncbi:tail protein X [Shewanella surugensis]
MIDAICWTHYGRESAAIEVMKANPGLAEFDAKLPSGLVIVLPDLPAQMSNDIGVSLWD